MNEEKIAQLCFECFSEYPGEVTRCAMGIGNYVYIVKIAGETYVVRCSSLKDAYKDSVYWLEKLKTVDIPIPKIIRRGRFEEYEFLILTYFEGQDIGFVYTQLTDGDKRAIAKEIVGIQQRVAALKLEDLAEDWSWFDFVREMLERAEMRIRKNGYFDPERVVRLWGLAEKLRGYFEAVESVAYLDDISSKNLIIHHGRISGIIDIDWMGVGDRLTYVALTKMALLNLEYDTDYVNYILEEMALTEPQKKAFQFYTLMYCVDFMGERGTTFWDKTVEVNVQIIARLNGIYDSLWRETL